MARWSDEIQVGMQSNPDREPGMELIHLREDLSLKDPIYLCASSIHTTQESLVNWDKLLNPPVNNPHIQLEL